MDSPRGRIYQMAQVANGATISASYIEHIELCLACRGCETACPSGVRYGRLVEAARAQIEDHIRRPWLARRLRALFFRKLLPSRPNLAMAGAMLYLYQASGLKWLVGVLGFLPARLRDVESLAPEIEAPFFFSYYGKTLAAEGAQRYRVAFLGGCIANVCFARLNEATVRVLRKNGCEVSIPEAQTCCGALHVHAGLAEDARKLARKNIDALPAADYDAIITNAAGCGSTLKEYGDLLEHDPVYAEKARALLRPDEGRQRVSRVDRVEPTSWPRPIQSRLIRIPAISRMARRFARLRDNCWEKYQVSNYVRCNYPIYAAAAPEFTISFTRICRWHCCVRRWMQ